jgi:acyl-coenzyme A thioesterase PaaI-like protein
VNIPWRVPYEEEGRFVIAVEPAFPNWKRSFVSGPESPLFELSHWRMEERPDLLLTRVRFKAAAEGPPGHIHGGASAGLLDEVMGVLAWHQNLPCVTRSIEVHYARALPLGIDGRIFTRIHRIEEKQIEVHSTIHDEHGLPQVSSKGLFHILSPDQLARFKERV